MLHILFLIIKCMGMALAFLLAVLLLAAAAVLFCPVRYCARGRKEAEEWECSARAGWLFGLASVAVLKGSGDSCMQIRLLGVKTSTWKKLFTRKKRPAGNRRPVKPLPEKRAQKQGTGEKTAMDAPGLPHSGECSQKAAKPQEKREDPIPPKPPKENFFKGLWRRIAEQYRSIRDALNRIVSAIRNLYGKIGLWKGFLGKTQTKEAFCLSWQQLLALLRHAGPQKWKGSVNLGLGDPAATGQALAVLGAAYPIHRGLLSIHPVWDRKILEGNVCVKGRIYGAALLYAACRLYFDKNVKGTLQWIMRQAG